MYFEQRLKNVQLSFCKLLILSNNGTLVWQGSCLRLRFIMLLNWKHGAFTSLQHTTMPSAVSALNLSRTLTPPLSSPQKRNAGHQPGTYWKLIGMRRPCKKWIMRKPQRNYARHTNISGISESAAACGCPPEMRDYHYILHSKAEPYDNLRTLF